MKRKLKRLAIIVARILGPLFYDKQYLRGRHFGNNGQGWIWVLKGIWFQKLLGFNRGIPWPTSPHITISNYKNIAFHPDDINNFQSPGCYLQNFSATIVIGKGTYIAPNVGIITANHNPMNLDEHLDGQDVVIGEVCWIGMNTVILPGVILGPHTIVAAGSVVTRSFPEGHCLVGGVPARTIKKYNSKEGN